MTNQPTPRSQPDPHAQRARTIIETDEDLRRALQAGLKGQAPVAATQAGPGPVAQAPAAAAGHPPASSPARPASSGEHAVYDQTGGDAGGRPASPFRPTLRPPFALLTVFDDGKTDGEVIRLRDSRFVIGRTEGDLRIPLDGRISSRHVEITHQEIGGLHRWVVTDLQSTHGLFARASTTLLTDKSEILVGNGRYRFDASASQGDPEATQDYSTNDSVRDETQGWDEDTAPFRPPALTEMIGREIGNRILLAQPEYWIGSAPGCAICRPDDPFCEPRHARLYRGPRGDWHAQHNKTLNGLWVRRNQITVEANSSARFQIGEQRFMLRVP
jgi:pSer/pThr/pTyr-binding forkhead associated (FHA) protein